MIKSVSGCPFFNAQLDRHLNHGPTDSGSPINDEEEAVAEFAKLLRDARAGDQQAVNTLLGNYRDYLAAIANRQLESAIRPKVAASDLVQQSLIAIQDEMEKFRGSTPAEFRAWIRQILANDLRDAKRKYRGAQKRTVAREHNLDDSRLAHPAVLDDQLTPSTDARAKEEAQILNLAISRLPENYRRTLQMRNWDEKDFESIGRELGCSAEAARKLWFRAVQRLKNELGKRIDPS